MMAKAPLDAERELREELGDLRFNDQPGITGTLAANLEPKHFEELLEFVAAHLEAAKREAREEAWVSLHQGATCCADKHQTFYGAVVRSPQWTAWEKHQRKQPTRDMAEVVETGVMSDGHFQEFLKFCLSHTPTQTPKGNKEEER